jgi:glycerol-3-phosphate dehydrogenase (NAD(P)+)
MEKIAIIGAGSWGSALARILGDNGHDVVLYDRNPETVNEINTLHTNIDKLPIGKLPDSVTATTEIRKAVEFGDIVVLAVPTKVIRDVIKEVNTVIDRPKLIVNASKGIEPDTYKRVSEIVYEVIDPSKILGFVALTGPSHGEEVIRQMLTVVAAASTSLECAERIQKIFSNHTYFRVYTVGDLIGAELGGSLKNIYAMASGMLYGLGYGDNARAALITRGLSEMSRLAKALGAKDETLFGLTGLGDLVVTTTSFHSRNFQAGIKIAQGENLHDTLASMSMVVEGARTCLSAYQAAKELNIYTPIIDAVYEVIYHEKPVKGAIDELMLKSLKPEN